MKIPIPDIRLDGGTQPRATLNSDVIEAYLDSMQAGAKFPPVDVFFDGSEYWLADGFHRVKAAWGAEFDAIECTVHQGTVADAQWFSFGVNKANGLYRSNEDKQRAVQAALRHAKSAGLSDHQIAKHVGVDVKTVGNWRKRSSPSMEIPKIDSRTATRNGMTYQINTANIGKRPQAVDLIAEDVPLAPRMPIAGSWQPERAAQLNEPVASDEPEDFDEFSVFWDAVQILRGLSDVPGIRAKVKQLSSWKVEEVSEAYDKFNQLLGK